MEETYTTLTQSIVRSYNNFIEQLPGIGIAIIIIVLGILIANWLGRFSRQKITARTNDPLTSSFLSKALKYTFISVSIMLALRAAGLGGVAAGILTAAGASAVVLGFAFKDIGENFIAGIILAFNRPFEVNDTVEIGDNFGKVKALELRYTKLKTFDGKDVYIPNSDVLTEPVTNFTEDGFFRWSFVVGIAYEDDIKGAKDSIMRALKNEPDVIEDDEHENFVIEDELSVSTVNLKVFFWVDTTDFRRMALITKGDVIRSVKESLEKDGYYLPADIQEIKLYGAEKDFTVRLSSDPDEKISQTRKVEE